jgi:hypothetical protein
MSWPPGDLPGGESVEGRLVLNLVGFLEALGLGSLERASGLAGAVVADPAAIEASTVAGLPPHFSLVTLTLCDLGQGTSDCFDLAMEAAKRRGTTAGIASGPGSRGLCATSTGS